MSTPTANPSSSTDTPPAEGIAIIGMSGRFPGAPTVDRFWRNLRDGVNGITCFSDEALRNAGVPESLLTHPHYVKARGILHDEAGFDAAFFGFSPREADITDPQQRLFLECAWEALEAAAYAPASFAGSIGVFAGASWSTYLFHLLEAPESWSALGSFQLAIGNEKDHLTTRLAYKLNLRGPGVTVQTACSTSLVAVSLACDSLTHGACDLALAGGASISVPQIAGYLYQEGGILCPDGRCRAFDAKAMGTIGGNGVGVVVLKRLRDAIADGDAIHAVIKGWAINNDGAAKVGYTAPGIDGQAAAIVAAHARAGVSSGTISYVEAHGTGTPLGDPIEIAALTEAFRRTASGDVRRGSCAIGSVKTNIGHLDAAAGVAGLIKTTMALEHGELPASLHFESPNPAIPFDSSPFVVNDRLRAWPAGDTPRRAGVSSFGIGGTNAHVVLEEAPPRSSSDAARGDVLLLLSAKTPSALDRAAANLAEHLATHPDANLADVAYTLQVGRTAFPHRLAVVCGTTAEAVDALGRERDRRRASSNANMRASDGAEGLTAAAPRPIVFMFPGQGSQHAGMFSGLYDSEPLYRARVDALIETLDPDLRRVIHPALTLPAQVTRSGGDVDLDDTLVAQPAIFIAEYALASLLMSWGLSPAAMIGHSVGEITAACLAGIFTPEDALALVVARARLMQDLPRGRMLAVPLPDAQVRALAGNVSIAAINGVALTTISGTAEAIDAVERDLRRRGIECRPLHTSHAFHSDAIDPIVGPFTDLVARVPRHAPRLPIVSNVTGTWLDASTACDPGYWGAHARHTVRFADGLATLFEGEERVLLETGPGQALAALAGRHPARRAGDLVLAAGRHQHDPHDDRRQLQTTLGQLWAGGIAVHWPAFWSHERRHRVSLPTYPFERTRHWIDTPKPAPAPAARESRRQQDDGPPSRLQRSADIADWTYVPTWTRRPAPAAAVGQVGEPSVWLIIEDDGGCGAACADALRRAGHQVVTASIGDDLPLGAETSYVTLLQDLDRRGLRPQAIGHFLTVTSAPLHARADEAQARGFDSLLHLGRALAHLRFAHDTSIVVVSNHLFDVLGDEPLSPEKATLLGPLKALPQEIPGLRCRVVDLGVTTVAATGASGTAIVDALAAELMLDVTPGVATEHAVAYRGTHRWVQSFEPWPLGESAARVRLPRGGTWLVTGGRGHIGSVIADYLARTSAANLVLVGRSSRPEHDARIAALEAHGVQVMTVAADAADAAAMRQVVGDARERFGRIDGVVHAAGLTDPRAFRGVDALDAPLCAAHLRPKAHAIVVLDALLRDDPPDTWLLISSLSAVVGGLGMAAYAGANAFLDTFAAERRRPGGPVWISLDWDGWLPPSERDERAPASSTAISIGEGVAVLDRILRQAEPPSQIAISTTDLRHRWDLWIALRSLSAGSASPSAPTPTPASAPADRPEATVPADADAFTSETELIVAKLWRELLGVRSLDEHDDFFRLGGHSLLAIQLISRLRNHFGVELSVHAIFEHRTIAALAALIDRRREDEKLARLEEMVSLVEGLSDDEIARLLVSDGAGEAGGADDDASEAGGGAASEAAAATNDLAWAPAKQFYDTINRQLDASEVGAFARFLNYGYVTNGGRDHATTELPSDMVSRTSVKLVLELVGDCPLDGRAVLDVGCGRGGLLDTLGRHFSPRRLVGVDLSSRAVAFCASSSRDRRASFLEGDAQRLPLASSIFDIVTNLESSHSYPDVHAFYREVFRVLVHGGRFLYSDAIETRELAARLAFLQEIGFVVDRQRDITTNVLLACDAASPNRVSAFPADGPVLRDFLAAPGSEPYEHLRDGRWTYVIWHLTRNGARA